MQFGTKICDISIRGTEVELFSNGACHHVAKDYSHDSIGQYLGLKYQCVEFVRRYIYLAYRINLANKWHDGDAKDWYANRKLMNLDAIELDNVKDGDIVTFTGGKWGHIGVIWKIDADCITIASQNFFNDARDGDFSVPKQYFIVGQPITDANENNFIFQSFLRVSEI